MNSFSFLKQEKRKFNLYILKQVSSTNDALAEWLRRVPAKYMGFPGESSNLSGVDLFFTLFFTIPAGQLRRRDGALLEGLLHMPGLQHNLHHGLPAAAIILLITQRYDHALIELA
jgi:hypothetical protein